MKYEQMVALLAKPGQDILDTLTPGKVNLWHMATGVCGEAGELLDAVKKVVAYNKGVDAENVVEELGDLEFYMEGVRQQMGITREETLAYNQEKLMKKRYPNGYSDAAAQARADKVETPALNTFTPVESDYNYMIGSCTDSENCSLCNTPLQLREVTQNHTGIPSNPRKILIDGDSHGI